MGKTIVFVSSVGGTGKTTLAATLSNRLCEKGKTVLLVETDPFRPLGVLLKKGEEAVYDLLDVLSGNCEVDDASVSVEEGFDMIMGPDDTLSDDMLKNLAGFIENMKSRYDFVIIDRPSGYDVKLESYLTNFLALVIHQNGDPLSLLAAEKMGAKLKGIETCESRLILNKFSYKKDKKLATNLDELSDKTGLKLLGVVSLDDDVISSRIKGELPQKGRFTDACMRIAERLLGEPTPLPNLKKM